MCRNGWVVVCHHSLTHSVPAAQTLISYFQSLACPIKDFPQYKRVFRKRYVLQKWNVLQNCKFHHNFYFFFKIYIFFRIAKFFWYFYIFLIFFSCKRIRSKNLFYFLNIEVLFWPPASAKIIFLFACLFATLPVRKSFRHNLLKGGIWPADHDGAIRIASKRPVRPLQVLFDPKSRCYQTPWKSNRGCPRPWTIQCHHLLVA